MDGGLALVLMATGRYKEFVPQAVDGAQAWLENLDQVYLLTDEPHVANAGVAALPWGRFDWPLPTLLRYRAISNYSHVLGQHDNILYLDVDMKLVRSVVFPRTGGLLATLHPYYHDRPRAEFTYETNSSSRFFVAEDEGKNYFCGGVQGGSSGAYLAMATELAAKIEADLADGITPIWHDESAWNRYCIDNPPATIWSEDYCVPEGQEDRNTRIIACNKDYRYLRGLEEPTSSKLSRMRRRAWSPLSRIVKSNPGEVGS